MNSCFEKNGHLVLKIVLRTIRMASEKDVDIEMLKAFYYAYKDGTKPPGTVRDFKDIKITGEEFIASQRRLMLANLLDGTETRVRAGTLYTPSDITDLGIQTYENNHVESLFHGIESIDLGYSGRRYRLQKWLRDNPKYVIGSIAIPIIIAIIGMIGIIL